VIYIVDKENVSQYGNLGLEEKLIAVWISWVPWASLLGPRHKKKRPQHKITDKQMGKSHNISKIEKLTQGSTLEIGRSSMGPKKK